MGVFGVSASCSVVTASLADRRAPLGVTRRAPITPLRKWTRPPAPHRTLDRNLAERNRLLVHHLPQVRFIARSIHKRLPQYLPLGDLVSAGFLGLIEALNRFDARKKVKLESFSKARIRGAILDSLRELDWCPRALRRKARQIDYALQKLGNRLGRMPTEAELAAELGISLGKFQRLRSELHGLETASLQALESGNGTGSRESNWVPPARTEDPFSLCLRGEKAQILERALQELSIRKRQVITLYYFEELTMKEIGARLRVGESRVSQLHSAAIEQLRPRVARLLGPQPRPLPQGRIPRAA